MTLGELSPPQHDKEVEAYTDLVERFGTAETLSLKEMVGNALYNKADVLGEMGPSQYKEAIKTYDHLIQHFEHSTEPSLQAFIAPALLNKSHALISLSPPRYNDAIRALSMISDQSSYDNVSYARHNLAYVLDRQGKYQAAHEAWNEARITYESFKEEASNDHNGPFFAYYGQILHEHFGELEYAEQVYNEGLKVAGDSLEIYIALVNLYLEQKTEIAQKTTEYHWKAFDAHEKAVELLRNKLGTAEEIQALPILGKLHLAMGQYEEADKYLMLAVEKIKSAATTGKYETHDSDVFTTLGVLYTRREDYLRAEEHFKISLRINPDDFNAWSNLAEVFLRQNKTEKAEREFQKILRITPGHVDTLTGLGQLYTTMADNGDADRYEQAVYHLTVAITFATDMQGSKRLTRTNLAAVYYSRGYAKIKLYENSKHVVTDSLLFGALDDFKTCCYYDPDHYKSRRALERLTQKISYLSPQRLTEKFGTWVMVFPSMFVFVFVQTSFFADWPHKSLGDTAFPVLTFGSLIFIIVGLFLPQLTKLKAGGVELEKNALDQITTSRSLGITK
jgi:tetratricopeptide (TPR) repeat protein